MRLHEEYRVPVQVGHSALDNLFRGLVIAPFAVSAAALLASFFGPLFALAVVIFGLVYCGQQFALAYRRRPSDVHIGPDGIRIESAEGDVAAGELLAWSDVRSDQVEILETAEQHLSLLGDPQSSGRDSDGDEQLAPDMVRAVMTDKLMLSLKDGRHIVLGSAQADADRESLRALSETLAALSTEHDATRDAPREPPDGARVMRCRSCGAPVTPSAEASIPCSHCRVPAQVPQDVRSRVRALEREAAERDQAGQLLRRLLRQPTARQSARSIAVGALLLSLCWVLSGTLVSVQGVRQVMGLASLIASLALPFVLGVAIYAGLQALLSSRIALRLLSLRFAALPPLERGARPRCHACGAPLPHDEGLLQPCAYCRAINLRALGMAQQGTARKDGGELGEDLQSLMGVLVARRTGRRAALSLAGLGALLFAAVLAAAIRLTTV